ncbi:DUF1941-domain-containing protein [Glonium stellatum]|uniref:DUF1941-domain-containing protein n=1 Tax=Glonium stellatum TaxID=574774 RepID=A0A8E2F5K9_9PEZI|nr:DUF1941-domain-containing protein [Glonium stellatum]
MASLQESSADTSTPSTRDPQAALTQTLSLLRSKNDTSRFVGLSLLRTLLDTHASLRDDPDIIMRCWSAISPRFLRKLLQARPTEKRSEAEANSMITLAVAVIHAFTVLLGKEALEERQVMALCEGLVESISFCSAETRVLTLQALSTITSRSKGASAVCQVEDFKPLVQAAVEDELAMSVIRFVLISTMEYSAGDSESIAQIEAKGDSITQALINAFEGKEQLRLLETIADVLEESRTSRNPLWLSQLISLIRRTFLASPNTKLYRASTRIIHHFTRTIPAFDPFFPEASNPPSKTPQPFSYLFINFLLIDIRATIPSLMEILASPAYPPTTLRLAAAYDVTGSFISTLVRLPDPSSTNAAAAQPPPRVLDIPPDLLLRLRKNLAETMSLTIEFLRDRWDAAVSGAAGLHPSALPTPQQPQPQQGPGQRRALTWESPTVALDADPAVVAGSRVLALWLHEDENVQLRAEAAGVMDVLLALYAVDGEAKGSGGAEYRNHVVLALEGITATAAGVESFLAQEGWERLVGDLQDCMRDAGGGGRDRRYPYRVLSIIRVLLAVVESEEVTQTKDEWLKFISFLARFKAPLVVSSSLNLNREELDPVEVFAAAGQLAVALVLKAPKKLQRSFKGDCDRICMSVKGLLAKGRDLLNEGTVEGLEEVVDGFAEPSK